MKIKKRFIESSFCKVFTIIKKNKNTYLHTIILDFIFLALIIFIGKYLGSLIPGDSQKLMELFKSQGNLLLFVIIYPLAYYLFIIFIYSITKLTILNILRQLYQKTRFSLRGLGRFYLLNILIFAIFLFAALIISGLLALILEKDFLKYVILILAFPFLFFAYSMLNILHTLYIKGTNRSIIRKSLNLSFKVSGYGSFLWWNLILISVYLLVYNLIHLIFRFTLFLNKDILAGFGPIYLNIFNIITIIFIYLIIAFNRIYFCERISKNVLQ